MKNALDWLVSFEGFVGKPVAVINTSPRAHHADESIQEILRTMSASLVTDACVTISLLGDCVTEEEMVNTPAVASHIRRTLAALALALALSDAQPTGPSFPL